MHSNILPLLGISTPEHISSVIQFSPILVNLGVEIHKGDYGIQEMNQTFVKRRDVGYDNF